MKSRICIALFLIASVPVCYSQQSSLPARLAIPDTKVLNQNGQHIHFTSGLLKNRIAVINTFFTNCVAICPITQQNFSRLAKSLGDRLGQDVVLVSISVDPANDTPERMKEWAAKFNVGQGWTLVSGAKPEIVLLLKSLGLFAPGVKRHQTAVLIGTEARGWMRASGFASADKLEKIVESITPPKRKGN